MEDKQEQIGFHKGALATLSKENQELVRLVKVTEELIKAHIKALKDLGIDIEAEARKAQEALKKEQDKFKNIQKPLKQEKTKLDERIA